MGLMPIDQALNRLLEKVLKLEAEWVPTQHALNRVLAQTLFAPKAYPFEDNSAMDGYALQAGAGPWTIIGESAAGARFDGIVQANQAVRIFTGGVVPEGADSILIQEDGCVNDKQLITTVTIRMGQHIRHSGSDLNPGQQLIAAGEVLRSSDLSALAGLGIEQIKCTRKPRITIFSTGDELIPLGQPRQTGQIYDSNALHLTHAAEAAGAQVIHCAHLTDDRQMIDRALNNQIIDSDLILLSGGVSVGDHDHVSAALSAIGGKLTFYKVAMKPGKPVAAAGVNNCTLLGLPGNPASTMVSFELFARPVIRRLLGANQIHRSLYKAPCLKPLPAGGKRHEFLRAKQTTEGLIPNDRQGSGDLSSLLQVDALVFRPALAPPCVAGQTQAYLRLTGPDCGHGPEAQWANQN